jgi:hypothetical protein
VVKSRGSNLPTPALRLCASSATNHRDFAKAQFLVIYRLSALLKIKIILLFDPGGKTINTYDPNRAAL